MGVIKTALEIALEKTAQINSDKSSILQFNAEQQGKKLANAFLAGDIDFAQLKQRADEIKKTAADDENIEESVKQGIFDVFISHITLPLAKEDLNKIDKLGKGFSTIIKSKEVTAFFNQLNQIFSQYLQEAAQYEQMVRQQYAPKLRQKEEELSQRFGREIKIDPLQDGEFVNFLNQHMTALKDNYEPVVEQAKSEILGMFNLE